MAKSEFGTKRVCPTTGKRFYDLNKNPVISPSIPARSCRSHRLPLRRRVGAAVPRDDDREDEDSTIIADEDEGDEDVADIIGDVRGDEET